MILIIAEKPSLARNIVAGIGNMTKNGNFYEGQGYIVTYAFGHLFSLCDIEDYTGPTSNGKWSMENLPCFPDNFKFKLKRDSQGNIDPGIKKQFELIETLCNREDVDTIVNAGDADREGEIIIRLCIENALKSKKTLLRLWLPDQTPETVSAAISEMRSESEYDNLANEGYARTYIDWLYGVNLTRFATLKTGMLLRVGRVIVPIVKAIYDRDMAIKNFVPQIYYVPTSSEVTNGEVIELSSKKRFDKNELNKAQELSDLYNQADAVVTNKNFKKDSISAGKLYSLSKLQNILGKKYKMSMDESLKIVQGLYEKGYLTYPRTNSEYLATTEKDKIAKIISKIATLGYPIKFKDKKTIFDDSKIESHSALTPTYKIPKKDNLTENEFKVYQTVFRRFVAVFCSEECIAQKTQLYIKVGDYEEFVLKGTVILQKGWTKYDDYKGKDKVLPSLNIGDKINIKFFPKQKETSPPKHYTIETLNQYLKNPFRDEKKLSNDSEEDDADEYRAMLNGLELGTEATRTGIIDNAIKSGYIDLKKDVYTIIDGGIYLIESLMYMGISMDKYKTSVIGQALKKVFKNELTINDSVKMAKDEIAQVFSLKETSPENDTYNGFYGDKIGACPLCSKDVIKGRYGYHCTGYKEGCNFKISGVICKRVISISKAQELINNYETGLIKGFVSKTGKTFDAKLTLENGKAVFKF